MQVFEQKLNSAIGAIADNKKIVWTRQVDNKMMFITFAAIDIITGQVQFLESANIREAFVESDQAMMVPKLMNEEDLYLSLLEVGFEPLVIDNRPRFSKAGSRGFSYKLTDYLTPVIHGPYTIENTLNPKQNKALMYGLLEQNAAIGVFANDPEEVTAEVINELLLFKNQMAGCDMPELRLLADKLEDDLAHMQKRGKYLDLATLYRYQASLHMGRLQVTAEKIKHAHELGYDTSYLQSPTDRIMWVSENNDGTFSYVARSVINIVNGQLQKILTNNLEKAFIEDALYRRVSDTATVIRKAEILRLQGYLPIRISDKDPFAGSQMYDFERRYSKITKKGRFTIENTFSTAINDRFLKTMAELIPPLLNLPRNQWYTYCLENKAACEDMELFKVVNEIIHLKNFIVIRPNNFLQQMVHLIEYQLERAERLNKRLSLEVLGEFANNLEFALMLIENDVIDNLHFDWQIDGIF